MSVDKAAESNIQREEIKDKNESSGKPLRERAVSKLLSIISKNRNKTPDETVAKIVNAEEGIAKESNQEKTPAEIIGENGVGDNGEEVLEDNDEESLPPQKQKKSHSRHVDIMVQKNGKDEYTEGGMHSSPTMLIDTLTSDLDLINKVQMGKKKLDRSVSIDDYKDSYKSKMDWLCEKAGRISEAESYIEKQQEILKRAASLTGLSDTEVENIQYMWNILGEIQDGMRVGGVVLPDKEKLSISEGEQSEGRLGDETVWEYMYHATPLMNLPSISENGLETSSHDYSKEKGTLWFNDYDNMANYLPALGLLLRAHVNAVPGLAESATDHEGKIKLIGEGNVTIHPVPSENLEYSLDRGISWRHDISKFREVII